MLHSVFSAVSHANKSGNSPVFSLLSLPFLSPQNLTSLPNNPCSSIFPAKMELQSPTTLVLCGKSTAENELARCLKSNSRLKVPDGSPLNVVLNSEIECKDRTENDGSFCLKSYMNSLSTSRFGRLLAYTPKLASTHDVVSRWDSFKNHMELMMLAESDRKSIMVSRVKKSTRKGSIFLNPLPECRCLWESQNSTPTRFVLVKRPSQDN